jgi:hypothetical protein
VSADRPRKTLVELALAAWQPRAKRELTREDGREIIANVTGFFRVLREWAARDQSARGDSRRKAEEGT